MTPGDIMRIRGKHHRAYLARKAMARPGRQDWIINYRITAIGDWGLPG